MYDLRIPRVLKYSGISGRLERRAIFIPRRVPRVSVTDAPTYVSIYLEDACGVRALVETCEREEGEW